MRKVDGVITRTIALPTTAAVHSPSHSSLHRSQALLNETWAMVPKNEIEVEFGPGALGIGFCGSVYTDYTVRIRDFTSVR